MRSAKALIVGGGPAGSATAIELAEAGLEPLLLDRSEGVRDVVCGGFLGWDALSLLDRIGIDPWALGAHPVRRLRLCAGRHVANIELPFLAAGLSRRTLDAALIAHASGRGARIERGVTVRSIDPDRRTVKLDTDEEIAADALFLASGKHDVRGVKRALGQGNVAIGLRARLQPTPALARQLDNHIELHFYEGGYAGLLLQEDGSINFCLTTARKLLDASNGEPEALVELLVRNNPLLGERLAQAAAASGWNAIARVPYGWTARRTSAGLFRVGDQAAVIPSIVGDGVAIALASGRMAAHAFRDGGSASAMQYQRDFAARLFWPMHAARFLRWLGEHPGVSAMAVPIMDRFPAMARAISRLSRIGGY